MANIFTQVTPTFTPVSYQEWIAPALQAQQQHEALEEKYNTLSDNTAALLANLDPTKDKTYYNTVQGYVNNLSNASSALAKNGIMGVDRTGLNRLRTNYRDAVMPIQNAATERKKYQEKHADDLARGIITNAPEHMGLEDFMNGKAPGYVNVDGNKLYTLNQAGAAAASKRLFSDPDFQKTKNLMYDIVSKKGYTKQDVDAFLNDINEGVEAGKSGYKELYEIITRSMAQTGADKFEEGSKAYNQAFSTAINGILAGLTGDISHNYQADFAGRANYQEALSLDTYKKKAEIDIAKAQAIEDVKNNGTESSGISMNYTDMQGNSNNLNTSTDRRSKSQKTVSDRLNNAKISNYGGYTTEKGAKEEEKLSKMHIGDISASDFIHSMLVAINTIQNSGATSNLMSGNWKQLSAQDIKFLEGIDGTQNLKNTCKRYEEIVKVYNTIQQEKQLIDNTLDNVSGILSPDASIDQKMEVARRYYSANGYTSNIYNIAPQLGTPIYSDSKIANLVKENMTSVQNTYKYDQVVSKVSDTLNDIAAKQNDGRNAPNAYLWDTDGNAVKVSDVVESKEKFDKAIHSSECRLNTLRVASSNGFHVVPVLITPDFIITYNERDILDDSDRVNGVIDAMMDMTKGAEQFDEDKYFRINGKDYKGQSYYDEYGVLHKQLTTAQGQVIADIDVAEPVTGIRQLENWAHSVIASSIVNNHS